MAESSAAIATIPPRDGRNHDRTHMFVAATLNWETGSCPIHIRNMSLHGALIEGAGLPDLGPVTLRRGALDASARIVWRAGRKAGIAFQGVMHAVDWMTRSPPGHQAQVDAMVREIRGSSGSPASAPAPLSAPRSLETELNALRAELTELGNGLTRDVIMVATHPEIQLIDVALQRVERMLTSNGVPY